MTLLTNVITGLGLIRRGRRNSAGFRRGRRRWITGTVLVFAALCCSTAHVRALDPTPITPPNLPPEIVDFGAVQGILEWTFEGRVLDENPVGLVIQFGGPLEGHQTVVQDPEGYFYYNAEPPRSGTVTAGTVDDQGEASEPASTLIL